jgi:hypothetical protein
MAALDRNLKGKVIWIPIAGSNKGHYNLGIIREGPMSRGQVKNSSIV